MSHLEAVVECMFSMFAMMKEGCSLEDNNLDMLMQVLSGDFQRTCDKMQSQILLGMRWCAMSIFFFLKFYNFVKGIMRIHSIFKKPKTNVVILHLLTF